MKTLYEIISIILFVAGGVWLVHCAQGTMINNTMMHSVEVEND